jgi:hypothetical protein
MNMEGNVKDMLEERIGEEFSQLYSCSDGAEKRQAIDGLVKLYQLWIDETRNEMDFYDKGETRVREEAMRKVQLKKETVDRYLKLGVDVSGIVLPLIFYAVWMTRGFKFEETGTYTSNTFRWLWSRFKAGKVG